jgi:hypothetical protein
MSYSETECALALFCCEAVPGLPAYTWPDWPFGLNGDCPDADPPGVVVKFWQLVEPLPPPVPGCPGPLGLGFAPATPEIPSTDAVAMRPTKATFRKSRMSCVLQSLVGEEGPFPVAS